MSSTRRDMLGLLPSAAASTTLPASLQAAPAVAPNPAADAALIAQCQKFTRLDQAMTSLQRQMDEMEEAGGTVPPQMRAEMQRLYRLQGELDELGTRPAATMAGLQAKARVQLAYLCRFDDGRFEGDERLIGSILVDLLRLSEAGTLT